MGKHSLTGALLIAGALLTGPAMAEEKAAAAVDPAAMTKFLDAYAAADAARKKAGSVGGEWRDTGKILKKAKKAAEAGDLDKAMKAVKTAHFQGDMGYQQAMEQKSAGHPSYLKALEK